MSKLLIILGPTATGKTELALSLAKKFNGELVACDSRQVYQGLDIGTGKLPGAKVRVEKNEGYWIINGVRISMYDVASLKKQYTVADYIENTAKVVDKVNEAGKLPIIVGGTGLYLRALLEGLSNLTIPTDKKLRKSLSKLEVRQLQNKLQTLSPTKWRQLNASDRQNKRRLLRSIELLHMNPYTNISKKRIGLKSNYDILKIGLSAPRDNLYTKINSRADKWIKDGIVDEVEKLIEKGISKKRFKEIGLEYGVIVDYLDGKVKSEELLQKMQAVTRQYAKRQITWFKKDSGVIWFDITESYLAKMEKSIFKWYHHPDAKKD